MIPALLRGKLSRDQENMEDLLTSMVFGLFQYVSWNDGLFKYLGLASSPDGRANPIVDYSSSAKVNFEFWPSWTHSDRHPCEPDLAIRISEAGKENLLILIEAKFRSGKSSHADENDPKATDQLSREWDHLIDIAAQESARPILVYLTNDHGVPLSEIEASVTNYAHAASGRQKPAEIFQCFWLSWRHIKRCFLNSPNPILKDIVATAERLDLTFFEGIRPMSLPRIRWSFSR